MWCSSCRRILIYSFSFTYQDQNDRATATTALFWIKMPWQTVFCFFLNIMSSHLFRCVLSHIFDRLILCRHIFTAQSYAFQGWMQCYWWSKEVKSDITIHFLSFIWGTCKPVRLLTKTCNTQYSQPLVQDIPPQPSLMYLFINTTVYCMFQMSLFKFVLRRILFN